MLFPLRGKIKVARSSAELSSTGEVQSARKIQSALHPHVQGSGNTGRLTALKAASDQTPPLLLPARKRSFSAIAPVPAFHPF